MATKKVTRREFIRIAGLATGTALLSACAPQVVTVTQVVKETSVVKETVKETQVVEKTVLKEVTPTAAPLITTPQGRELPADAAPLDKQILYGEAPGERKHFDYVR